MNPVNIVLNIVVILYFGVLLFVYFSKKNYDNEENKLYRYLLIFNALLVMIHFAWLFIGVFFRGHLFFLNFVLNVYELFLILWYFVLAYYTVLISFENDKKFMSFYFTHKDIINKIFWITSLLLCSVCFLLTNEISYDKNGILLNCVGTSLYYCDILIILALFLCLFAVFKNIKNLDRVKLTPYIIMSILGIIMLIFLVIYPTACVTIAITSLVCYVMYFTIENPDIEMISELTLAKSQAEKANEAKSDFLSSMSHEIRTPLNAIVGLAQMISDGDNVEDMKNDSKDIVIASQNLLEIVNGILDINKLEANKIEVINTDYNPIDIFNEVMKMIRIRLGDKNLDLRTYYSDKIPSTLNGDKDKVKQILTNLLTNAIKYTDNGFVELNVTCDINNDICNLRIEVRDTGRGIKEEQKALLFTKFNRLEEDKDSDIEGTGLGLAITKSLVDIFGGKIDVQSTYGEGSTFTVSIPQVIVNNNYNDNNII